MPFVKAIVPEVDVAGGRVIVTPPAGLFEDLPAEDGDEEPDDSRRPRRLPTRTIPRRADVRIDVVSIFPSFFDVLEVSLLGKARGNGLLDVRVHDLRDWTHDRHRTVDDTPYGGGAGMVMKPEPWGEALDAIASEDDTGGAGRPVFIFPSPAGELFSQATARELAGAIAPGLRLRPVRRHRRARVRTRGIARRRAAREPRGLRPQRGRGRRHGDDRGHRRGSSPASSATPRAWSRSRTRTDCWSTRPTRSRRPGADWTSPPVLLSGNHGAIAAWRREQQLERTQERRPDLLEGEDRAL